MNKHKEWLISSYNFGKAGNNCSDIYFNYGTPEFTLSSDNPDILKIMYNACETGKSDKLTGGNNLPLLIEEL